jgi:transposase-like protein
MKQPKTLQQAILYFADLDNCLKLMVARRWPNGVECPTCGRKDVVFLTNQRKWQCKSVHAKRQFSAKVGTIFEDSALGLDKWLAAVWMITNCKNGISSYEVARALDVTQKTAWFMLHRIRLAMHMPAFGQLGGKNKEVEVDEAFIGGAARFMHKQRRERMITSRGPSNKAAALGILERGGEIRTFAVPNRRKHSLQSEVIKHVKEDTPVYTDALMSYMGLRARYEHDVIDHARGYVRGRVHTNGLENFWSLFKRGIRGTYISIEPFHLSRYLDEQTFRYNHRGFPNKPIKDGDRFTTVMSHILGKRLTYAELTGKVGTTNPELN